MASFKNPREVWDRRYREADGFLFGRAPNRWLARQAPLIPAGSEVLCVADGEGRNGVALARLGHRVTSFDLSPVGVARARELSAAAGVELDARIADVEAWTWEPDRYDAVVAIFVQFASPPVRARLFAGVARTVRPGGFVIIEGYGPRQLDYRTGGPGIAENLYSMQMLLDAFRGWDLLAGRDADLVLDEGAGHHGRSHSIAAVFRRRRCGERSLRA